MDDDQKTPAQLIHELTALRQQLTDLQARAPHANAAPQDGFRVVLMALTDAIYAVDTAGRFTWVNPAFEALSGYAESELIGQPSLRLYPSEAEPIFMARRYQAQHHTLPPPYLETTLIRRDGHMVTVELAVTSLVVEGQLPHRVTMVRDITERKESETLCSQLAAIVDSTDDAIWSETLQGVVTSWNRGAERLYGYTSKDMLGQTIARLMPRDRWDELRTIFDQLRLGKSLLRYETQHLTQDGMRLDVSLTISPITNREGHAVGASVIARDITEQKRAESELNQRNLDLKTLLYIISHDLREPLRAMQGFSRILYEQHATRLDEKGQDFLRRIVRAVVHMGGLLDDLLTLSRLQRMEPPAEAVDSGLIVRDVLLQLDHQIRATGAQVHVVSPLPYLWANRTWATQAVYNLVANALKFTLAGRMPQVEISPFQIDDEVGLVVRDRGIGVEPSQMRRIFQLFYRGVGREVPGSGAGLAIVHLVAERHGGRAWVQPRQGGGSEFIITFGSQMLTPDHDLQKRH